MDGEDIINDSGDHDAELQQTESLQRLTRYKLFVVKPEEVDALWEAEDPCMHCQELLQEYIKLYSSEHKKDINKYSQNEMRYEKNWELKWIADYIINALVYVKSELKMEDTDAIAETLQALWETLDFLNVNDVIQDGGKAVNSRFMILQQQCSQLYATKKITSKQVEGLLTYTRRTLFMHLQLFLTCCKRKQERREKPIIIQQLIPQVATMGGLDEGCTEIKDEEDEGEAIANVEMEGASVDGDVKEDDKEPMEEEEKEEIVDPEDPLYGLEQRLKYAKLDDQTKSLIKAKLKDAQSKIRGNLDARQTNLDSKLGAGSKKK